MLKNIRVPRGKALRNPALYVMHHGARYLFPLVLTPYLARQFGPSYFADFVIWNSCVWTASLFMEYGFFLYAVNETALSKGKEELGNTFSKILSAKLSLLPIALIVYSLLSVCLGIGARQPVAAVIGVAAMLSYGGSFAWYFQGQERAGTAVSVEAVPQVIQFLLVFFLVHGAKDLWVAAALQTVAAVCTIAIALVFIARDRIKLQLGANGVLTSIRAATPFFIERLCLTLYQSATPLFISMFSYKIQAAYYSVGDKFLQFLGGLSIPLSYAFLPIISRHVAAERSDWKISVRMTTIVFMVTSFLAIVSCYSARFVILLLFRNAYASAIPIAQCFCFTACLVSYNTSIANFILVPGKRARVLIVTSLTALTLSLGSQAFLLPRFGAFGSAMARTLAELGVAVILTVAAGRLMKSRKANSALHSGKAALPHQHTADVTTDARI